MKKFGEFIKLLRSQRNISLRKFCIELDYDPSNWSKIERGLMLPPRSKEFLVRIAEILRLEPRSEEYFFLFDSAAAAQIPVELIGNENILEKLPVFFRTARGDNPTKEELENLLNLIKNS
ncbi:MAG: helix-turn-helix domain-containing protein [Mangrovibacterium sp.]